MRIYWHINNSDVVKVRKIVESQRNSPMVTNRRQRYLGRAHSPVSRAVFWRGCIMGLVTSQQPSGPGTMVRKFLRRHPFPLTFERCRDQKDLRRYAELEFQRAHVRFWENLADRVEANFEYLNGGGWAETRTVLERLRKARKRGPSAAKKCERESSEFIAQMFKGFGPKQSRNTLQHLGLTRFEIPLDSRLMKWLNQFGFPIKLAAQGLSDQYYYNFVLDGVQVLCEKSRVEPYILDAAIFSSFDDSVSRAE